MSSTKSTTPARRQYLELKRQHPGVILFFRMGDFYETFDDDAITIAEALDITLTSREMGSGNRIPMAGIPYHAAEGYLARLLAQGIKVAIAEQMSGPSSKGIVDRQVTSIVTPGTVTQPGLLRDNANQFVAALVSEGARAGLAFADATTGEFATTQLQAASIEELADLTRRELLRIVPVEIVTSGDELLLQVVPAAIVRSDVDPRAWRSGTAAETLIEHFDVTSLEPFGCDRLPLATRAAGALLAYLQQTQLNSLQQITTLYTYSTERFMSLDAQTRRNLELAESTSRNGGPTLYSTLNATQTPLGGRLLLRWIGQPLLDRIEIEARYDGVEWFLAQPLTRAKARQALRGVGDIERVINRVVNQQAGPRELARLGESLARLPALCALLETADPPEIVGGLPDCPEVADELSRAIADEPPALLTHGQALRPGYNAELDALRQTHARDLDYIAGLEATERQRTGIRSLKVGYNKVFGYYLEISNANRQEAPEHYIRKQTLVNAERYITPELKEAEQRVLHAEERITAAEQEAYAQVISFVSGYAARIREIARRLAIVDVLAGLAELAAARGYVRPEIVDEDVLEIDAGRHPIIEREIPGSAFVPNNTTLGDQAGRIAIITGPNMAGKSTYLRQVALLVLLAQIGSFVPAAKMRFGLADRIFTRIGAQDDLASGQSTFMVEMLETATILNHASRRSLVVLDEIGRGTSTYDGLAIATAIIEYIHHTPRLCCKTLFATHYHELTALAEILPQVRNYRVDVLEAGEQITFLYRVVPGGADRSYGVYVAQLAGMPQGVLRRAEDILTDLEESGAKGERSARRAAAVTSVTSMQLSFFGGPSPALKALQELEVDALTPLEALTRLYELKRLARDDGKHDR
jgi:DNA mismatch repair protein MutS